MRWIYRRFPMATVTGGMASGFLVVWGTLTLLHGAGPSALREVAGSMLASSWVPTVVMVLPAVGVLLARRLRGLPLRYWPAKIDRWSAREPPGWVRWCRENSWLLFFTTMIAVMVILDATGPLLGLYRMAALDANSWRSALNTLIPLFVTFLVLDWLGVSLRPWRKASGEAGR